MKYPDQKEKKNSVINFLNYGIFKMKIEDVFKIKNDIYI